MTAIAKCVVLFVSNGFRRKKDKERHGKKVLTTKTRQLLWTIELDKMNWTLKENGPEKNDP